MILLLQPKILYGCMAINSDKLSANPITTFQLVSVPLSFAILSEKWQMKKIIHILDAVILRRL
jgi:hypothetical protein